MQLEIIKLNYDITNRALIKYLENLEETVKTVSEEEIKNYFVTTKGEFARLMEACNAITEECQNGIYVKDVQYSLLEGLFLFSDLAKFYEAGLQDRMKLRIMNYIQRDRIHRIL